MNEPISQNNNDVDINDVDISCRCDCPINNENESILLAMIFMNHNLRSFFMIIAELIAPVINNDNAINIHMNNVKHSNIRNGLS